MAFNNIKVVGDGTAQTVLTNSSNLEGVITNLVAYNGTGGALSFSLLVDGTSVITESVPANGSYRLTDKVNVPVNTVLTINAATGVDVTISSYQAAIDTNAALSLAQTTAATTAGYLDAFQADYIGTYANDAAANASGFTIGAGVFYFEDTGTPATSGLRIYDGSAWSEAVLDASGAMMETGGTFTGLVKSPSYEDAVVVLSGTTPAIDLAAVGEYRLTITGNTTFTVSNPPASDYTTTKTLRITQGGTAYSLTFWAGMQSVDGEIPAAPAINETKEYTLRASTVSGTTGYLLTETGVVS
jgi:hypothetical protein